MPVSKVLGHPFIILCLVISSFLVFPVYGQQRETREQLGYFAYASYGYTEHVYQQYTGNSRFQGGNAPSLSIYNGAYEHMLDLNFDLPVPKGFSFGVEYLQFTSTTASSVPIESGQEKPDTSGLPKIDMLMEIITGNMKLYLINNLSQEGPNAYLGFGWGWLSGYFDTTDSSVDTKSNFNGVTHYFQAGGEYNTGLFTIRFDLRPVFAQNIKVSQDPYNQATRDDGLYIDFSGLMFAFQIAFRF